MTRARLTLLGLCTALIGLMAFGAGAAQAEVGAKWLLAKSDGTLVNFLEASLGLETDVAFVMHTEIAKIKILFLCSTVSAINFVLKANGTIGEGARIKFSGCDTDLNGPTSKPCLPLDEDNGEADVILTNPLHGLLILHKLASGTIDDLIKLLPDVGNVFMRIHMSAECAIGKLISVIGSATLKDCQGLGRTHLVKHLVEFGSEAELTKLFAISETPEHKFFILGSAWAFLTGAHSGMKFGGDPA